jgi:glucose-1-phosphate thymidylyltransferase
LQRSKRLKGVILCAGRGTRLQPLTYSMPKPLVPVANKPVLQVAIESMRSVGIEEIGLVVREGIEEIKTLFGSGASWGVRLTYIRQRDPKGTGHAVQTALPFVGNSPFVLYLGDNLFGDSLERLVSTYESEHPNAVIGVKEVPNPQAYGVISVQNGDVVGVIEKPVHPPSNLALTGLFILDSAASAAFTDLPISPRGEIELTDGLRTMVEWGLKVRANQLSRWWVDIGSATNLLVANRYVLDDLQQLDAHGSIAPDVIIENSSITGPVSIASGAVIRNSRIGPYTSIGTGALVEDTVIENSIVLRHSVITNVKSIRNSIVGAESHITGTGNQAVRALLVAHKSQIHLCEEA